MAIRFGKFELLSQLSLILLRQTGQITNSLFIKPNQTFKCQQQQSMFDKGVSTLLKYQILESLGSIFC